MTSVQMWKFHSNPTKNILLEVDPNPKPPL